MCGPSYNTHHLQEQRVGTQHGQQYKWGGTKDEMHPGTHYASVMFKSVPRAILHSYAAIPSPLTPPTAFLETLESFGNPSLWESLVVNGDGG
jgi:hypothetical protein